MGGGRVMGSGAQFDGGASHSRTDGEEHEPSHQTQIDQYEASNNTSSPLKTNGEDGPASDVQIDEFRPGTSDTNYSTHSEFDHTEDGLKLAELTFDPKAGQHRDERATSPPFRPGSFYARPQPGSDPNERSDFLFARPSRQRMDFTGTRKGPVFTPTADLQPAYHNLDVPMTDIHGHPQSGAAGLDPSAIGNVPTLNEKRSYMKKPSPRDGTSTPSKDQTAPIDATAGPSTAARAVTQALDQISKDQHARLPAGFVADLEPPSTLHVHVGGNGSTHIHKQPKEHGNAGTPVWPGKPVQDSTFAHQSSPHVELQHDVQIAALASAAETDNLCGRGEVPRPEVEPLSPPRERARAPSVDESRTAYSRTEPTTIAPNQPTVIRSSKKRSKGGHQSVQAEQVAPTQPPQAEGALSDVHDFLNIVSYKIRLAEQDVDTRFQAERQTLHTELQQAYDARQTLHEESEALKQQKCDLEILLEKQHSKVALYEGKIKKFKTFVDGLGNDVNALKKEADTTRRRSEQLTREGDEHKAEQSALYDKLSACASRAGQLKDEALRTCQELQRELQAATIRCTYLEKELGDKIGLLAEERDRRSQMERQLATAATTTASTECMIKATNEAVLDKLFEIHAVVEGVERSKAVDELIERTSAAIQAINSQQCSNADEISSVRDLVEALVGNMTKASNHEVEQQDNALTEDKLRMELQAALKELTAELGQREQLFRQDATHRESIAELQGRLEASNVRIYTLDAQLQASQKREADLKESEAAVRRLSNAQHELSIGENSQFQLEQVKAELESVKRDLDEKCRALEISRADFIRRGEEYHALAAANAKLLLQVQSLEDSLREALSRNTDFGLEREALERKHQADLHRAQCEVRQAAEEFKSHEETKHDSGLQRLREQHESDERKIRSLTQELTKHSLQEKELRKQSSSSYEATRRELEEATEVARSRAQEIVTFKASLQETQENAHRGNSLLKKVSDDLSARLEDVERAKVEALARASELKVALEESQSRLNQLRAASETHQQEREVLQHRLTEADKTAQQSQAELKHCKETNKQAIDALHERLREAQQVAKSNTADHESFRAQVEEIYNADVAKQQEQVVELKRKADRAERDRDEVEAKNEDLRLKLAAAEEKLTTKEETRMLAVHKQSLMTGTDAFENELQHGQIKDEIMTMASKKDDQPLRARKRVDRNTSNIIPGGLSSVSRRTGDDMPARTAIVGALRMQETWSQSRADADTEVVVPRSSDGSSLSQEIMLDMGLEKMSQVTRTIDGTQSREHLPSFAAFNAKAAEPLQGGHDTVKAAGSLRDDFIIYKDDAQSTQYGLQDTITSSAFDKEAYTSKKTFARPNSSKRRQSDVRSSSLSSIVSTNHQRSESLVGGGGGRKELQLSGTNQIRGTHTSSPDFVHDIGQKITTYQTSGVQAAKRRSSRTESVPTIDPRLLTREMAAPPPVKRKAEGSIVDGYEQERKKRLNTSSTPRAETLWRHQTRGALQSQQSINDLPRVPTPAAPSSTRARTRASGASTTGRTRSVKRMNQREEFSARFAQELGGR